MLALELKQDWLQEIQQSDQTPDKSKLKLLLASSFGSAAPNRSALIALPLDALHLDLISEESDLKELNQQIPAHWLLSAGVINGRNIWRKNLSRWYQDLLRL